MLKTFLIGSAALGLAAASVLKPIDERGSPVKPRQASCTVNAPGTRSCWPNDSKGNAFSIDTDAESSWPQGGPTSTHTLIITKQTGVPSSSAPDGTSKDMILINGSSPGPTITANWGDHLEITVINNLADNGTSMHWHGVQQKNSVQSDGVNGVTECPIPGNGGKRVYKFVANEHGSTWYHSHYSWQYGDGLYGALVINGPASADYNIDLGPVMISDYYYKSMYRSNLEAAGAIVKADNVVINGKQKSASGGSYSVTTLTAGKKHRLRLINTSVDTHFYVSLDSHTFQVIQADFVPIKPYNTTWLFLAIGQRYDVIINADQVATPGDYWFRTSIASGCGTLKAGVAAGKSIFRYNSASTADPTSVAAAQSLTACVDEKLTNLRPVVSKAVPKFNYDARSQLLPIAFAGKTVNNIVQWNVNGSAMNIDWSSPTLEYVNNGTAMTTKSLNLLTIPETSEWAYWIVSGGGNHPIHLHGHDFYVLGSGTSTGISTFSQSTIDSLNFKDPARRDVAMMSGGWVALAFPTNNPGAWLMHCHIAWHISGGLGVQFLEGASKIKTTPGVDLSQIQPQCNDWDAWYAKSPYKKDDSGL